MTIEEIESLLDSYMYALLFYENSQTCNPETYRKQEQEMYDSREDLLSAISDLISNQK